MMLLSTRLNVTTDGNQSLFISLYSRDVDLDGS